MRLTYQTGIATLIQFILVSLFTLFSQIGSTVTSCHQDSGDCITNVITSIIFYMVVAIAFGMIWLIGYSAQTRRSRRRAQLLITVEGFVGLVALFSLKLNLRTKNIAGLIASFGMLVLAFWIITLAFRLMRAGNRRVVNRQRTRQRPDV